jgi:tetratricopeptide (TPR) repeat protein
MMQSRHLLVGLVVLLAGCTAKKPESPPATHDVPLYAGLGNRSRPISTTSPEAQRYFDQGLSFLYAFNHDEAIRSFRKAAESDPKCAMAWWGIAVANGPHINNPVVPPDRAEAAWTALQQAQAHTGGASDKERALITALSSRYANPQPENRAALDAAYADAMRNVWQTYPHDDDIGALFAEAMMDLRPWDLWTAEGAPQPGTEEIVATLETVLATSPDHPLALHLYIHAVEAGPAPEKADAAADRLRDLQPGLGHLVHMPSHIDVRRGRWEQAMLANAKAMRADEEYRAQSPRQGFYGLYMTHNYHMYAYAAMMCGRRTDAVRAMDAGVAWMPQEWKKEFAPIADGYTAMPLEVRMRFGMWDEILAAPEPDSEFRFARAMRHYARGVAYAARGQTSAARDEQRAFLAAKAEVPSDAAFGNNSAADLLAVATEVLEGEILYREGDQEAGLQALQRAVEHEDALRYDEPPDWIQPVRHALGASLLRSKRYPEAEIVFREDLQKLPDNGWGLFGLARSLRGQSKHAEAAEIEERFRIIWAGADVELSSPCYCQPGV